MGKNKTIKIIDLGHKSYSESLEVQENYFNGTISLKRSNRKTDNPQPTHNYLLWVEHPPVFTPVSYRHLPLPTTWSGRMT